MLAIVFILGLMHDILCAFYLRAVAAKRPGLAAMISGILTTFGYYVWVVTQEQNSMAGVVAYALGGALGTYLGLVIHGRIHQTTESNR